jgi:hypothetical protein
MKELVPFFVITLIILVAFMSMYYVKRFDDGYVKGDGGKECDPLVDASCSCDEEFQVNFCTYTDSFYNVFGYLGGGPDETTDVLDIIFIFLTVIIFLNVLIAIVSNAW